MQPWSAYWLNIVLTAMAGSYKHIEEAVGGYQLKVNGVPRPFQVSTEYFCFCPCRLVDNRHSQLTNSLGTKYYPLHFLGKRRVLASSAVFLCMSQSGLDSPQG